MSIPYEERFRICEKQSKPAGCAAGKKTCRPSLKPGRWRVSRRASAPPRGVHTTQRTCANEGQSHKPKCSILGPRSGLNVKFEAENDAMMTSKTIAALLGPRLVASAISLLANLGTSRTIIEGLSQSPALIMIAGYAAFVPGLAIVYFHNRWTGGWPVLVTVMGWLSLVVGLLRMVVPHTDRRTNDENRSVRRRRLSCRRGRIPADRRIPFVQGIRSRVTTPAVLGGSATGPLALREFSPPRKSGLPWRAPAMPNG